MIYEPIIKMCDSCNAENTIITQGFDTDGDVAHIKCVKCNHPMTIILDAGKVSERSTMVFTWHDVKISKFSKGNIYACNNMVVMLLDATARVTPQSWNCDCECLVLYSKDAAAITHTISVPQEVLQNLNPIDLGQILSERGLLK